MSLSVLNASDCICDSLRRCRSFNPYLCRLLPFHLAYVAVLRPCSIWGTSGEGTRLPPMWPGFKVIYRFSLLLVLLLAPRVFYPLGTPVISSPYSNSHGHVSTRS